MEVKIPVFIRGKRNYVQGTQIIARAAELIADETFNFHQASFHQITDKLLMISDNADLKESADFIGEVVFLKGLEKVNLFVIKSSYLAPIRDIPMDMEIKFVQSIENEIFYSLEKCNDWESLINGIVQVFVIEHKRIFPKAKDIWLTGIRNTLIPLAVQAKNEKRSLKIKLKRSYKSELNNQTLWEFSLNTPSSSSFDGITTFSYKE